MNNKYEKLSLKNFKGISDYFEYQKNSYKEKLKNDIPSNRAARYEKNYYDDFNDNLEENVEYIHIEAPEYDYSAGPVLEVKEYSIGPDGSVREEVDINDIFVVSDEEARRAAELQRLYNTNGITYRFNRGIAVIGKDGKKVEDVFDGTSKHHATSLVRIAKEDFNIEVTFSGIASDIASAVEAGDKGLTSMFYEGNGCMIFIPEDLTVETIDAMIEEIEPRDDFIFTIVRTFDKFRENLTADQLLEFLRKLKATKEKQQEQTPEQPREENDKLSVNEYINRLLKFLEENNMSLLEYYRNIGRIYKTKEESYLPDFEKQNPFIDENDIKLLVESEDNMIIEYFARATFKVVNLNIIEDKKQHVTTSGEYTGNPEPKKKEEDTPSEELVSMIQETEEEIIEDISFDNLDDLDGYVVINDDSNINIYTYSKEDKTVLNDRVTYNAKEYNLRNGYYVSIDQFLASISEKYSDGNISFVTENGEEKGIDAITNELSNFCIDQGGISLENEGKEKLFINRRDLRLFMKKYKVKYVKSELKEENMIYRTKESIFLSGAYPSNLKLFYDDYIADKKDLFKLINLFIIETLTQGGVKDYNTLKRDILNVYGYQYIFLFRDLEAIGLLKEKEVLKNLALPSKNFPFLFNFCLYFY